MIINISGRQLLGEGFFYRLAKLFETERLVENLINAQSVQITVLKTLAPAGDEDYMGVETSFSYSAGDIPS